MLIKKHLIISLIISTFLYFVFHSVKLAVGSFLSGVLIDLDHITDYVYNLGCKTLNYRNLVDACRNSKLPKLFLFLHSYELLLVILIISLFTKSEFWIGVSIGFAQHLFFDQISNSTHRFAYFLSFRLKGNFENRRIFPDFK